MQRFGLSVQEATPEIQAAWERDVEEHNEALLEVFDTEMTLRIQRLLDEFGRP